MSTYGRVWLYRATEVESGGGQSESFRPRGAHPGRQRSWQFSPPARLPLCLPSALLLLLPTTPAPGLAFVTGPTDTVSSRNGAGERASGPGLGPQFLL